VENIRGNIKEYRWLEEIFENTRSKIEAKAAGRRR
jgi:hypothetical protein